MVMPLLGPAQLQGMSKGLVHTVHPLHETHACISGTCRRWVTVWLVQRKRALRASAPFQSWTTITHTHLPHHGW
jgi:hypothetical protein